MTLSTQFGLPISSRRTVWACASGLFAFALSKGSGKTIFDSIIIDALMAGFTSCIPLTLSPPEEDVK